MSILSAAISAVSLACKVEPLLVSMASSLLDISINCNQKIDLVYWHIL